MTGRMRGVVLGYMTNQERGGKVWVVVVAVAEQSVAFNSTGMQREMRWSVLCPDVISNKG